ncbi:hypothetical protein H1R20_g2144, partial [Candolleomyces eurysporus]
MLVDSVKAAHRSCELINRQWSVHVRMNVLNFLIIETQQTSFSSTTIMSRRLYLGRLPPDVRTEDVSKFFDGYGRIVDCRVMTGFGFVEFESYKDAEDALHNFNGKPFMGTNIVVEFAKESRPRREVYALISIFVRNQTDIDTSMRIWSTGRSSSLWIPVEGFVIAPGNSTAVLGEAIPVIGLVLDGCPYHVPTIVRYDLKDFGRDAGSVSFADVDRDNAGQGILEYLSRDDAERAIRDLDGKDLRGKVVRVELDENRGGPDNYRRDDRREDRYRDERPRDDRYRRERSRSPRRDDGRRPRSPPPRRDDDRRPVVDEYRRGYEDRRPDEYYADRERRREEPERKREDRRRDDKDDRYDDRSARHSNGDAGWAR